MPRRSIFLFAVWMVLNLFASAAQADVVPPLAVNIQADEKEPGNLRALVTAGVPETGSNREARVELKLVAEGVVRVSGPTEWTIEPVQPGEPYRFEVRLSLAGKGGGSLRAEARSFDAHGRQLWARADALFVLETPGDRLLGKSSQFELRREKLRRDHDKGRLDERQYKEEIERLLDGKELRFEREMKGLPTETTAEAPRPLAKIALSVVSGRITYTPRIGWNRTTRTATFGLGNRALPVRRARVRFFDSDGTELLSTPAVVTTGDDGRYSASVPGERPDTTAVQLIVRAVAENPAVRVGPLGQRVNLYSRSAAPVAVTTASTTVDLVVDDTDLLSLRAFSIADGMLTAYDYVQGGAGASPSQIFAEFPGSRANGSFFSADGDDHLNIGEGHAFDWDVYTHEYGHYVQKINHTSQSPGGCHFIGANLTGFDQAQTFCNGPNRVLDKDQAIKLAWGEGWPTFFGTSLQIQSGVGALGIYGVADTKYEDTAQNLTYDLEVNADYRNPAGEDNELSVQRILWDFADSAQDGHDELTYSNGPLQDLMVETSVVTLDAFRHHFDGMVPGSPAGYSTGSAEENRAKQGAVYFDLNVGPAPVAPADNSDLDPARPPTFRWETRGAGPAPSYRFNKFNVLFFSEDYSQRIFTSPEIATTGNAATAEWTPTPAEWSTITGAGPAGPPSLVKWVVEGRNDSLAPATGPYRGLAWTLGAVDVALVIDDTGSMAEEIGGVRTALTNYISRLRSLSLPRPPLVQVVTFKDDVTHRLTSRDLNAVQGVVDSLVATGGGDCPESSVEALVDTAKNLGRGKVIVFATDASPHRGFDLDGAKLEIRNRGIVLSQLVTGDCSTSEPLAAKSGGNPNRDPSYTPAPAHRARPDVYWDVACPDCPPGEGAGPALSPNALALVGDLSLPESSSIVSYQDLATASPLGAFLFFPGVNEGDPAPFENAVTNAALAASVPTVLVAQPTDLPQGATLDVEILGGGTNFRPTSIASLGSGVTVNSLRVLSPGVLVLNVTVAAGAAPGFRDVMVTTPLGVGVMEHAGGTGQLRVVSNFGSPALVSVQPRMIAQGSTVELVLSGVNTGFTAPVTVEIDGLTVRSVTVLSSISLRVGVEVPSDAPLGFRTIRVNPGGSEVTLGDALAVLAELTPGSGIPSIVALTPASGTRGTTLTLHVTGFNTHFVNGVTVASIGGMGVTVLSTTVTSPTEANVQVQIDPTAALGFRDVTLVTGGETAAQLGALLIEVTGGPAPSEIPTLGEMGLVLLSLLLAIAGLLIVKRRRTA